MDKYPLKLFQNQPWFLRLELSHNKQKIEKGKTIWALLKSQERSLFLL
jgi:hypothetical protein